MSAEELEKLKEEDGRLYHEAEVRLTPEEFEAIFAARAERRPKIKKEIDDNPAIEDKEAALKLRELKDSIAEFKKIVEEQPLLYKLRYAFKIEGSGYNKAMIDAYIIDLYSDSSIIVEDIKPYEADDTPIPFRVREAIKHDDGKWWFHENHPEKGIIEELMSDEDIKFYGLK